MTPAQKIFAGTASAFALAAGLHACGLIGDVEVDVRKAFCEVKEDAKYPVRIIDAEDGSILREGGFKRFEMDDEKRTCLYREKSGDGFIYQMKP